MANEPGIFEVSFDDGAARPRTVIEKDSIFLGRLATSDIVLDDPAVSRVHAGINVRGSKYELINVSSVNPLSINGRAIAPQDSDVLADGDVVQIGPFTIAVTRLEDRLHLRVQRQNVAVSAAAVKSEKPQTSNSADVLQVFWEKRTREKESRGSRLRPSEKPLPGKAMFNWRPTRDLRRPWRFGLFVWAFLLIGAVGAYAFFNRPGVYSPKPLSNPHSAKFESTAVAAKENGNSCTTCHTPNEPLENSCISCHQAAEFHATNTKAHEQAGITCTVCHQEHRGADHQITAAAVQGCAECHNDNNKKTYNGFAVKTPHKGGYGYPVEDGAWKWKGVYREVAEAVPEINSSATSDKDEQSRLSRQFHTIHVARLRAPAGVKADSKGLVSCSTCHNSFDPVDRETPRQTCAACHTTPEGAKDRDMRFGVGSANCISCHVQHPYSAGRWNEFLTDAAIERRREAVTGKIATFSQK
jgi:hypothetical protein